MTPYLLMAISALILAFSSTPLLRRVALRTGVVDNPEARKIHRNPVPLLGGAAIYIAFIVALVFLGDRRYVNEVVGIFVGATLVSLMGLVDDRWGLGSYIKLLGQLAVALILIYSGVRVQLFHNWLDIVITLVWVIGITNALNLLDNMDGLSGGIAMIAAIFFTLLAAMSDQYLVGALAAALAGACAGFLFHNWNPANVFMGDTGSLFIGFLRAAVGIKLRFPSNSNAITWMIPLLVLINNNRSYFNDELHQETVARRRNRPVENRWIGQRISDPDVDIAKLAEAQGAVGIGPVIELDQLKDALEHGLEVLNSGGVCVVDIHVTPGKERSAAETIQARS